MKLKDLNNNIQIIFIQFKFYRMPAPTAETTAPPRTELQEIQLKAQEKTDEVNNE